MIMTVGIWLFTALSLTRRILGTDYMGRDTVRTIAFAAILFGIASRPWVLVDEKWREREKNRRKERTVGRHSGDDRLARVSSGGYRRSRTCHVGGSACAGTCTSPSSRAST